MSDTSCNSLLLTSDEGESASDSSGDESRVDKSKSEDDETEDSEKEIDYNGNEGDGLASYYPPNVPLDYPTNDRHFESDVDDPDELAVRDLETSSVIDLNENVASENSLPSSSKVLMSSAPNWKGQTLQPPRRKTINPSRVWKFGGFLKDKRGNLLTSHTVCGLCGIEIKYS